MRVRLCPESGRRHQLRLHMLALGCPIVGDTLYAPTVSASRLHLHASELGFAHPATGEWTLFTSAPPFVPPRTVRSPPPRGVPPAVWRCWEAVRGLCGCAAAYPSSAASDKHVQSDML